MKLHKTLLIVLSLNLLIHWMVYAGEADVVEVKVARQNDGSFNFSVTVQHADEGWQHYANKWEVVAPDGTILATRILRHPHVKEQPFTRSLSGVEIPEKITKVIVRAQGSVHEQGGREVMVLLPQR